MSEFEYDSYDISAIKVSFENLRRAERQGFWAGLLIGSPLAYYISINKQVAKKCTMSRWTVGLSGLVLGSLIYGAYIFQARQSYNDVAARVNRKYSLLINKAITY